MTTHHDRHELAGCTVVVKTRIPLFGTWNNSDAAVPFLVEDWWDRVSGGSWMTATGNLACRHYAARGGIVALPIDDEVVYGHTADGLGHLVHVTEIQDMT